MLANFYSSPRGEESVKAKKKLVIENVDSQSHVGEPMMQNVKYLDDLDSRLDFALSDNGSTSAGSALNLSSRSPFSARRGGLGESGSDRSFQTKREYNLSQAALSPRDRSRNTKSVLSHVGSRQRRTASEESVDSLHANHSYSNLTTAVYDHTGAPTFEEWSKQKDAMMQTLFSDGKGDESQSEIRLSVKTAPNPRRESSLGNRSMRDRTRI